MTPRVYKKTQQTNKNPQLTPHLTTTYPEPVCIQQGFTIDGHLNGLDEEEDYVDKCIFVEGQDAPTDLPIGGTTVKSSLIGFHVTEMHIHNCGYVVFVLMMDALSQIHKIA